MNQSAIPSQVVFPELNQDLKLTSPTNRTRHQPGASGVSFKVFSMPSSPARLQLVSPSNNKRGSNLNSTIQIQQFNATAMTFATLDKT